MSSHLPRCMTLLYADNGMSLVGCGLPAEYWDCSDPIGGPVCEKHACARHGGKRKLDPEELACALKEYGPADDSDRS